MWTLNGTHRYIGQAEDMQRRANEHRRNIVKEHYRRPGYMPKTAGLTPRARAVIEIEGVQSWDVEVLEHVCLEDLDAAESEHIEKHGFHNLLNTVRPAKLPRRRQPTGGQTSRGDSLDPAPDSEYQFFHCDLEWAQGEGARVIPFAIIAAILIIALLAGL